MNILETLFYILLMLLGVGVGYFVTRIWSNKPIKVLFILMCIAISFLVIYFIDVEFPIGDSTFRDSSRVMPYELACVFVVLKYLFLGAIFNNVSTSSNKQNNADFGADAPPSVRKR